jgi:hypothetical protein
MTTEDQPEEVTEDEHDPLASEADVDEGPPDDEDADGS